MSIWELGLEKAECDHGACLKETLQVSVEERCQEAVFGVVEVGRPGPECTLLLIHNAGSWSAAQMGC